MVVFLIRLLYVIDRFIVKKIKDEVIIVRCLSLDFGGSSVKYGIVDQDGRLGKIERVPAPLESREQFVELVKELYGKVKEEVDGIAISMPGYIDARTGTLSHTGMYQQLWGICIPQLLQELKCPVTVENDGNCGALSELWKGALEGCRDGAVIMLGSGIGGGILKEGKIHHGKSAAAGEISYMILKPGKYGFGNSAIFDIGMIGMTYKMCLAKKLDLSVQDYRETLIAIDGMNAESPLRGGQLKRIKADGKQMFVWLEEGDPEIARIYDEFIENLAALVNNIQVVYAPEKIAIGGGLSTQERVFADLQKELEKFYASMGMEDALKADVCACKYLDETNLLGAAYHFMTGREG